MQDLPETRASLILKLQNADELAAWDEFAAVYGPVIFRSARRLGLQSADADDCVQEVLSAVARSVEAWLERDDRGAFRAWLFRITRNTAVNFLTRRKHQAWAAGGDHAAHQLQELQVRSQASSRFDLEYRRSLFLRSSAIVQQQVSESTWQAFHRSSVLQEPIEQVAADLQLSVGSVYIARSRVMKRLQNVVRSLQENSDDEV